jgi:preprotein translocase subunit SecE
MSSLGGFLKESYVEFKEKVEWPKASDLYSSTAVVSISTVILSLFTFGVDSAFRSSIKSIYSLLIGLFN